MILHDEITVDFATLSGTTVAPREGQVSTIIESHSCRVQKNCVKFTIKRMKSFGKSSTGDEEQISQ